MHPFDYQLTTRLVFGPNRIEQLGELAKEQGAGRVLVVSDPGIVKAGHTERGVAALKAAGCEVLVDENVGENPTTAHVEVGTERARDFRPDVLVGLGGGSSMDCAKGINFVITNGGKIEDYWGINKATKPMLPLICVPTTAGTGSEAQSFAVIAHPKTHLKMACGDKKAAAKVAILDPDLTLSMPASVTAATGIDALSHALESAVTTRRTPVSQIFSRQAWQLLCRAFPAVLLAPKSRPARGAMLLGSYLAGAAIENSMLGATHASANPLTAHYDLPHGIAIGLMLPHVIRYNAGVAAAWYGELAADAGLCTADDPAAAGQLAGFVTQLVARSGGPTTLTECRVDPTLIPTLAAEAAEQWTGKFNPRPVGAPDFEELYRCALHS